MDRDIAVALFVVGFCSLYALIPLWLAVTAYRCRKNSLLWGLLGLLLSISTFFLCAAVLSTTEFGSSIIRRLGPMSLLFGFGFLVAAFISSQISSRLLNSGVQANGDPHSPNTIWADGVPGRALVQLAFAILGLGLAMTWLLSRVVPLPGTIGGVPYPISIIGILGCGGLVLTNSSSLVARLRSVQIKRSLWVRVVPPAILVAVIACVVAGWSWSLDRHRTDLTTTIRPSSDSPIETIPEQQSVPSEMP